MAKETLQKYLNRMLKSKGTTVTSEKKKASKYTSISAAKKAGSLYYTNKKGKVMAAVFGSDLKDIKAKPKVVRPRKRPDTVELAGYPYGQMTVAEKREVDLANRAVNSPNPNAARKKRITDAAAIKNANLTGAAWMRTHTSAQYAALTKAQASALGLPRSRVAAMAPNNPFRTLKFKDGQGWDYSNPSKTRRGGGIDPLRLANQ